MTWRLADSLIKLRDQVNAMWPNRSKASDGSIGDAAHATRDSDHNPWIILNGIGIVSAIDITNDPASGASMEWLAGKLEASRDDRIKYVIWNRRILKSYVDGSGRPAWIWQAYTGTNPHDHHLHISVKSEPAYFDNTRPWVILLTSEELSAMKLFRIDGEDPVWGVSDDWMFKRHITDGAELPQWEFLLGRDANGNLRGVVDVIAPNTALWLRNLPVFNEVNVAVSGTSLTDGDLDRVATRVITKLKGSIQP